MTHSFFLLLGCSTLLFSCAEGMGEHEGERADIFDRYEDASRAELQSAIDGAVLLEGIGPNQRLKKADHTTAVFAPAAVSFVRYEHQELEVFVNEPSAGVTIERYCLFAVGEDAGLCLRPEYKSYLTNMSTGWANRANLWTNDYGWEDGTQYDVFVQTTAPATISVRVGLRSEYHEVPQAELQSLLSSATRLEPVITNNKWSFRTEESAPPAGGYRFALDLQDDTFLSFSDLGVDHRLMGICLVPDNSKDAECTVGSSAALYASSIWDNGGLGATFKRFAQGKYEILVVSEPSFLAKEVKPGFAITSFTSYLRIDPQ